MVKLLSMFHLHCNFVNLWRMAKQSSRYALKKGLSQAFHVWLQPLFQQGLEIWVKGSHLLYWATNQPESFTSDVRWDVLEIAKIYPSQVWCHVRESACERKSEFVKIWVLISDYIISKLSPLKQKPLVVGCWNSFPPPKKKEQKITNHARWVPTIVIRGVTLLLIAGMGPFPLWN